MVCVSFPKSCKCGPTRSRLATCQDLDEYESSNVVEFQDVEILNQVPECVEAHMLLASVLIRSGE